jgi:hypothetical protein
VKKWSSFEEGMNEAPDRGLLFGHQIPKLLSQSAEHAAFRYPDCSGRHREIKGDVLWGAAFYHGSPECLPCPGFKLAANQFEGAKEEPSFFRGVSGAVRFSRGWRSCLTQPELRLGAADPAGLASHSPEVVAHFVLRDSPEPATERISFSILSKTSDRRHDRLEDVLQDVRDIMFLKFKVTAPMVDQRGIELDQPVPGRRLTSLDAFQQTSMRAA